MRRWQQAFTAEGLNIEKLIHQAGEAGIILVGLRRASRRKISGYAVEDDLPRLTELAEQGGWKLSIGSRQGTGHALETLRKRKILVAGALLAAGLLWLSMQLVWRIDVRNAGVYEADLRAYLDMLEIRPLQWKSRIDPASLRDTLEWRYPDVAWIECGWRGMTLCITVVEGVPDGDALTWNGSGDVIASRDGVVDRVMTLAGTAQVKAGDVVRKGDVLILGEERSSDGTVRSVSARGKVYARVWESVQVQMNLTETETVPTGREEQVWIAETPWFGLWKTADSGFEYQDVSVRSWTLGGLFLPVTLRQETRMEVTFRTRKRDLQAVKEEAERAAMRLLQEKLRIGDEFLTKWIDYSIVDAEILCADAYGELVTDIGAQTSRQMQ